MQTLPQWWQCSTLEFKVEILFSIVLKPRLRIFLKCNFTLYKWEKSTSISTYRVDHRSGGLCPPSSLFQRTKYRSVEIIITVLYDSTGIKCGFINGNKRSTSNSTCVCWNSTTKKSNSFWIYTYPRKKNSYCTIPFTGLYLASWNIRWPLSCRQSVRDHVTKGS